METLPSPAVAAAPGRPLRITYWIVTVLLCLNLFAGVLDIIKADAIRQSTQSIGFPLTILPFLGTLKILGGLVLLFVRHPVLKIATYAGAVFYFLGAVATHLTVGQPLSTAFPAFVMLMLAGASFGLWYKLNQVRFITAED